MTPAVDSPLERSLPTPFLTKTYQLVEDPCSDDIISWNDDGSAFVVWKPAEFARDLLPKYFKHNNFSSFVRQLNTYGFRKIVPDRWEFSNESFKKGEKQLLREIQRRKISTPATPTTPTAVAAAAAAAVTVAIPAANPSGSSNSGDEQVVSSNSSPPPPSVTIAAGCSSDLLEENERLRRENSRLANELGKMKNLCSNIYSLMSKYGGESPSVGAAVELNLLPRQMSEVSQECTKIFGVSIGSKRAREEVDSNVKLEPFDSGSGSGSGSNLQSECIDKSLLGKKV